jgi:hypothetical protein
MGQTSSSVTEASSSDRDRLCDDYETASSHYDDDADYDDDDSNDDDDNDVSYSDDDSKSPEDDDSVEDSVEADQDDDQDADLEGDKENNKSNENLPQDKPSTSMKVEEKVAEEEKESAMKNKVDLLSLSNDELKSHLSNYYHMTKHDIRNAAYKMQQQHNHDSGHDDDIYYAEWYQQPNDDRIKIDKNNGTVKNTTSNRSYMELAMSILKLSPQFKTLRFTLVPAKLSECKFWSAVFFLLEHDSPDDVGASSTIMEAMRRTPAKNQSKAVTKDATNTATKAVTNDTTTSITVTKAVTNSSEFDIVLKQKDEEIAKLRSQLTVARNELSNLQKPPSSPTCRHLGKWVLSKEANEFMALDEEIKEKLRDGKQKRLKEVLEQMKFILDSDDVKDSHGKWDCCGKTLYDSSCMSVDVLIK